MMTEDETCRDEALCRVRREIHMGCASAGSASKSETGVEPR
jgi:hypothetical protein